MDSLLRESEAAEMLGISRSSLIRLAEKEKELRPVYPSVGTKRYVASQLQAYIERIVDRGY